MLISPIYYSNASRPNVNYQSESTYTIVCRPGKPNDDCNYQTQKEHYDIGNVIMLFILFVVFIAFIARPRL